MRPRGIAAWLGTAARTSLLSTNRLVPISWNNDISDDVDEINYCSTVNGGGMRLELVLHDGRFTLRRQ